MADDLGYNTGGAVIVPGTEPHKYEGAGVLLTDDEMYNINGFKGFEHTEDWMIDLTL